jgi:hypothetical protein
MNARRSTAVTVAALSLSAAALLGTGRDELGAADHGDSPQVRDDTRLDIADVYLFASPETPANTVMVMTVCPLAGLTGPKQFTPGAKYEFAIDTNNDLVEDQVYSFVFAKPDASGHQSYTLSGPKIGTKKVKIKGTTEDTTVTFADGGGKVYAGLRDDPFFFDLIGFKKGLVFSAATSHNFFAGLNVMAIVVEVPTTAFGTLTSGMRMWARTKKGAKQIDRMGRPAINTVLISGGEPGGNKDLFNRGSPKDDVAKWRAEVVKNLKAAPLSRTDTDAGIIADILLPDVLSYDPTDPSGFINGRKLTDDVIDFELSVLSTTVSTDFVGDDNTFLATFPYLGEPNP